MEGGDGSQFMSQFKGSAVANLVFMIVFVVYKFIDKRCQHSSCESNTRCCKCSAHEDSFSDDDINKGEHDRIIKDLEKEIDKIKGKLAESVRSCTAEAIQRSRTERKRGSRDSIVAVGKKAESRV